MAAEHSAADALSLTAGPVGGHGLLRFITCGSVDDGKSTLIGRLLFDSKQLFDDQLSALARESLKSGTQDGALDLALALDGLSAEREQGITIDVAYRFFSTERRSFIVADTPGHAEYTRNMATGASNAEAAVLLVDARKGLSAQTRRHTLLVATLGIRHVVVAVNKMDLVGWSEEAFGAILNEYRAITADLGFRSLIGIPISAKLGDNVTRLSDAMPWYKGVDLLTHLETVELGHGEAADAPFRLAVQLVSRPNPDFRGFAGLVSGAPVRAGQSVVVLPSGERTRVARIVTFDGDLDEALPGQAVTLTLADEVDASRGAVIAEARHLPRVTSRIDLRVFWMAKTPMEVGASLLAKIGTQTVGATVTAIDGRIDLETLETSPTTMLAVNDLGAASVAFDRLVVADAYDANRDTGSLILIDPESFDTVAMGLVRPARHELGQAAGADGAIPETGWSPLMQSWLPAPFAAPWRSALKIASWRVAGTLVTVAAAWWLTHDARITALMAAVDLVVKAALQFGHERIWTRIGIGLRSPAA